MATICRGCSRPATFKGLCDRCQRIPTARPASKPWRGKRKRAYALSADTTWREMSKRFLEANIWCARCLLQDSKTLAKVSDHIIPVSHRPQLKHDPTNLQPLCKPCHSVKTGAERRGIAYDYMRRVQYRIGKPPQNRPATAL